ncbi:hypothetical protein [Amycolatopsis sp. CB00013]|uniref:hypothetical protein n=1 Tax=Amycolatopsis sp. CB00013 TaxID=1703945 RepID=UPI00093BC88B|nr:hypothetical protein [Amycolatopsis sp. CB00013]OKJ97875.1 hypothetical protein AMK34_13045 [Amycolatopsis sp. CB00013]
MLPAWLAGVPLAKDRLREHRIPCTAGMTVRDLAAAAHGSADRSTVDGLLLLTSSVDVTPWSGVGTEFTGRSRHRPPGTSEDPSLEPDPLPLEIRRIEPRRPL